MMREREIRVWGEAVALLTSTSNSFYPSEFYISQRRNYFQELESSKEIPFKNVNIRNQFQIIKESDQNLLVFGGSWSLWSSGREGGTSERGLIDC